MEMPKKQDPRIVKLEFKNVPFYLVPKGWGNNHRVKLWPKNIF